MKCAKCSGTLQAVKAKNIEVDQCTSCGGIWFDLFELERMDNPQGPATWLLENIRIDIGLDIDYGDLIDCPRCEGSRLIRQQYPKD